MSTHRKKGSPWRAAGAVAALALLISVTVQGCSLGHMTTVNVDPEAQCRVNVGDVSKAITLEQAGNVAIIVGESIRRGLAPRAASIGLMTAWQESTLYNLDYGDRDSLGLFQQRPSQGWGSEAEIMDPWYSAGRFYAALVKVPNWDTSDLNDVAQAVQRSAYPDHYRKHESYARAWASALTGHSPGSVRCVSDAATPGNPDALVEYLRRVWDQGQLQISQAGNQIAITAPDETTAWALAQLSMLTIANTGVSAVAVGSEYWTHSTTALPGWSPSPTDQAPTQTLNPNQVVITTRT